MLARLTARRLRLSGTTLLHGLTYAYDNDDNPLSITDEVDASRTVAFTYDAAERLARVDMAAGTTRREDFIHDANGNRIRVERRALPTDVTAASTDTYTRTAGTNRIASIATAAGTRTLSHDVRGNLSAEARPGSISVTTAYDGYGRLTGYTRTGQPSLTMLYNGSDERVALTRGGTTTRFIHDPDGRIIGEYTASPTTPIAEYIWLLPETGDASEVGGDDGLGGWHPLSIVTANGAGGPATLFWLHSNHLGTPVRASTASGASAPLTGFTLPGFPGQLQTLPDLYYNQHRDYDPTTGRYIQADPIGLAGDANPYLYAGASPMRFVDPEGLTAMTRAMERDATEYFEGRITEEEFHDRNNARGIGTAIGLAVLATRGACLRLLAYLPRIGLRTTAHGAGRIAGAGATRGGSLTAAQIRATQVYGQRFVQADGAIVRVVQQGNRFNVAVFARNGRYITSVRTSLRGVRRLAYNYGWRTR